MSDLQPLTNAQRFVRGQAPDAENREKDDFYPTPPAATEALLRVERFEGAIWECACGDGAISQVLEAQGYDVVSTDLVARGYGTPRVDFLLERQALAPNIVTNPPFKNAEAFAAHAVALASGKVAMLFRLAFLAGQARRRFFESTPLSAVWVFSKRLAIARGRQALPMDGGGMIDFAWFVWDHAHQGPPRLGWVTA